MTTVSVSQNVIGWQLHRARVRAAEPYALLKKAFWYERSIPQRHRFIFYLGHLEAFDWNLICRDHLGLRSFHPSFDRLFAFGIDPPSDTAPGDAASDWPAIEEVEAYSTRVRASVDASIKAVPEQLMRVAIEHRLMHAETLAYMLHALPYDSKEPQVDPPSPLLEERVSPTVKIPAGTAHLGRDRGTGFGWDNEFEEHEVSLPAFEIDRYKVTNGDYLELVKQGVPEPHFWVRRERGWGLRTMFKEIPLPLDWPAWVTHQEADRYARWRAKRLPTEAEYHRAAYGDRDLDPGRVHADFHGWSPVSVYADAGRGPFDTRQMVGNGWEWTSTIFAPFKGFVPFPFYPGYSADFFDGQHWVIKGGSPRTAGCLLRRSFRNWFRGEYPYVYAGFRCVAS